MYIEVYGLSDVMNFNLLVTLDCMILRLYFCSYVRIPFEIKTPSFFITIHDKLATLRIDGRDMSVKFPEQFNIALNGKKTLCCYELFSETSKRKKYVGRNHTYTCTVWS